MVLRADSAVCTSVPSSFDFPQR